MPGLDWARAAREGIAQDKLAMVTILATDGSAPRDAGTRMLVGETSLIGTIGGGRLEQCAIEQARSILRLRAGSWRVQDYPLGPLLGQCCGGKVRLLVEHLDAAHAGWLDETAPGGTLLHRFEQDHIERSYGSQALPPAGTRDPKPAAGTVIAEGLAGVGRPVLLFGAGHVGRAIMDRSTGLPLDFTWADSRTEAAEQPGVEVVPAEEMEARAAGASPRHAILIMTHDHGLDYRLTAAALRSDAAFIGLIGSATKRARFLSRLAKDRVGPAQRARLTCPIGIPEIIGKEPEVIAIAVLAQLLSQPNGRT